MMVIPATGPTVRGSWPIFQETDVPDITATCGCGRSMSSTGQHGRGAYRCGCGTSVTIAISEKPSCWSFTDTGERCRMVPSPEASLIGLTLCGEHFARLGEMFEAIRIDKTEQAVAAREAELEAREAKWHADVTGFIAEARADIAVRRLPFNAARDELDARLTWVVYYVRIRDVIKIGTTSDLSRRLSALMADEVLAVEPGGLTLERERHQQFARWRMRGERFYPGPDLMAHIREVHSQHPDLIPRQGRQAAVGTGKPL